MLVEKLFELFTGSVEFTASGGFPERFINLCALKDIPLNGLYCSGGVLRGRTSIKGYKKMRVPAKSSGMRIKLRNKRGLPFFLRNNRKRAGILAGAAVFAVITVFLSTRIWSVEVEGNVLIRDEEILAVFEELGVRVGAAKSSLDKWEIQAAAAKRMERVMWLSLNIDGSAAVIEVREVTEPSRKVSDGVPCNIISSNDGIVETVEAYSGKAEVKKGDGVRKGSLLVSGVTENKDLTVTFRPADAYVTALTEHKYSAVILLEDTPKRAALRQKRHYLHFLNFKIPLKISFKKLTDCEVYSSERSLSARGKKLPLGIITERYTEKETTPLTLSENMAIKAAYEQIMHRMVPELLNGDITAVAVKKKLSADEARLDMTVNCLENIGRRARIDVDEGAR